MWRISRILVTMIAPAPETTILERIHLLRGQKVMLDQDLAALYGIETKAFNQAVKRNIERFPEDFMFELTHEEFEHLRSQNVTSSWGGRRYLPKAFTEQGVAMLSGILSTPIAIEVKIRIIRVFARMREMLITQQDILLRLEQLERQTVDQSKEIELIFSALRELLQPPSPPRKAIGYVK
jgi:hypothetical protein